MGSRLRDMIRAVRACKTAAEERAVIAKECASLRTAFKENEQDFRHRNVAKLMFIHMLGYPTHFGQMECLKLIASPGFPEKRIGYLGLMLLLDERQEVLMLVTNSLKNDLNQGNQFICGLALCALGNICSSEMARDLAPEVERLLSSSNPYLRKKAALCSIRIIRKVPDLADYLLSPAASLLQDKHHGVLLSGIKLAIQLCHTHPPAIDHFRKMVTPLVRILKNLVVSGYAPEYDVAGLTDPFLQIRVLRLLRIIGQGDADASDIMSDVLAQVATNTEANKNAGNAILYEAVSTIFGVEAIGGLRVLAINILGRFLTNRDNNIRYVALNTLIKVVAVDTQAVQRHRGTIVDCVKDSDISIRRRALELVFALVNESNVKTLVKELLDYLKKSDAEFKGDLTAKICALVQRFAPSKQYHIDIILKVMQEAGQYVAEDVIRFLIVLISNSPDLQPYAVRSFFRAFQTWQGQESLALVTVWSIGEFGDLLLLNSQLLEGEQPLTASESDAISTIEAALRDSRSTPLIRAYALVALLKLTSRLPASSDRISALMTQYRSSIALELQQRSVEFSSIMSRHDKIKAVLLDRMPPLNEAAYRSKKAELSSAMGGEGTGAGGEPKANGAAFKAPAVAAAPVLADLLDLTDDIPSASFPSAAATAAPLGDSLLDILGGGGGVPPATAAVPAASPDNLLDLLSLSDPTPPPAAAAAAPSAAPVDPLASFLTPSAPISTPPLSAAADPFAGFAASSAPAAPAGIPSIMAFQAKGLSISFDFSKDASTPHATTIVASYSNSDSSPLTDFVFQAAVPKFMQLQLEPASGSVIPPNNTGVVKQTLRVTNNMHGQKALVMKLRISYKKNGEDILEQGQVNNFPQGL